MASQTLRERPNDGPSVSTATTKPKPENSERRARKMALARKGFRSLAVAVTVPLILTALASYVSGCSASLPNKPTWHPPVWAFHLASVVTASLMGLSAWLVWAEGALLREPSLLGMCLAQLFLGLAWGPLVFGLGAVWAGLVVCGAQFGVMLMCSQRFKKVNTVAGDLVKPCLAWVSFLAVFNYKLLV